MVEIPEGIEQTVPDVAETAATTSTETKSGPTETKSGIDSEASADPDASAEIGTKASPSIMPLAYAVS